MPDPAAGATIKTDVCVIGGGPAGSTLARRLKQLGHAVVVVEKKCFPRSHVGESLVAGVLPLLDVLGLRREIESAGFLRPQGAIVRWSGPVEWRRMALEPGFQVDRARFDNILLAASAEAGARVLQPARPRALRYSNGRWRINVDYKAADLMIESTFVADATGRAGVLAGSRRRSGERTLALYAYWRSLPPCGAETRVEAGENEWYWGAPLPGGEFNATVFINASRCRQGIAEAGSLDTFYETLIANSELLSFCLQGSRRGPACACDATTYDDDAPVTPNTIKVGEAAFSIDPLSSQGVQTALGSALHAAAVIHTMIARPQDSALAMEFYRMRQQESVSLHAGAVANFYGEVAQVRSSDFWRSRAAGWDRPAPPPPPPQQPALAAGTKVQLAPEVRIEMLPCVQGDFIEATPAVILPGTSRPTTFLDGIAVAPLLTIIEPPITAQQVLEAWVRLIPAHRATAILTWLWEQRVLRPT
jgi:flavin-dependent dehydrogenase